MTGHTHNAEECMFTCVICQQRLDSKELFTMTPLRAGYRQ